MKDLHEGILQTFADAQGHADSAHEWEQVGLTIGLFVGERVLPQDAAYMAKVAPATTSRVPCTRGCGRDQELREGCVRPVPCACGRKEKAS